MIVPPIPENELDRLQALHALKILDTPRDARFDCITRFAAEKLEAPICLVNLIDEDRQWSKSVWGMDSGNMKRDISFCGHAICETNDHHPRSRIIEYVDTHDDPRFSYHPLVVNEPFVRSYIGFILQSEVGVNIGAMCLLGDKPRKYNDDEIDLVVELGGMIEELIIFGGHVTSEIDIK